MFYNLLINENHIIDKDISNNSNIDNFIKQHKYYILETVYNFLNNNTEKHNEKSYFIFLNFILELKNIKDQEELFIETFNNIEDISFNYDISNDIVLYKKLFLNNNKETKTTTIERIFKLDTNI